MKTAKKKKNPPSFDFQPYHVRIIFKIVRAVLQEAVHADRAIQSAFNEHRHWSDTVRGFVAETTYDIIRNWRWLWHGVTGPVSFDEPRLWRLFGVWLVKQKLTIPPYVELKNINAEAIKVRLKQSNLPLPIRESVPDWLHRRAEKELSDRWPAVLHALNQPPVQVIRLNRLKTNLTKLRPLLHAKKIDTSRVDWAPDAILLKNYTVVFRLEIFKNGYFEVQDTASQMVAPFLQVEPGHRVIDGCAGTGGKSLHLAALMHNKGRLVALDTDEWKLKILRQRAARAGVDVLETRVVNTPKIIKRLKHSADRVLLDVPCSGLGVLRRNPDIKWRLQPTDLDRLIALQQDLLQKYSDLVRPGGKLVYSTCSILPSEGEQQIERFLEDNPNFKLEDERRYDPDRDGFDGFYMARLVHLVPSGQVTSQKVLSI